MGGTIWVDSVPGVGSTFHFTMLLPWAPQEEPGLPPGRPAPSKASSRTTAASDKGGGLPAADNLSSDGSVTLTVGSGGSAPPAIHVSSTKQPPQARETPAFATAANGLIPGRVLSGEDTSAASWSGEATGLVPRTPSVSLSSPLAAANKRGVRATPAEAFAALTGGLGSRHGLTSPTGAPCPEDSTTCSAHMRGHLMTALQVLLLSPMRLLPRTLYKGKSGVADRDNSRRRAGQHSGSTRLSVPAYSGSLHRSLLFPGV